jgi:hypothetical protein
MRELTDRTPTVSRRLVEAFCEEGNYEFWKFRENVLLLRGVRWGLRFA